MSSNFKKTYTSQIIGNSKFLLAIVTATAIVIDALITVLLIVGGYNPKYMIFPGVLLILDALYFVVGMTLTNYRFRYSIGVWLSYILLATAACVCGTLLILQQDGTVLTYVALGLWVGVHAFSIVCSLMTALYASKVIINRAFTVIITLILTAVSVGYAVFLINTGFFGQGNGHRTLTYEYNEREDCYSVIGVLEGKGKKVEIDSTFNGKPVNYVSCSVFTEQSVKEYILHDNFELVNIDELSNGNVEGKKILVDKEYASGFRTQLFSCARSQKNRTNALALANSTVPYHLEDGFGYVAFNYDEQAYDACNGKVLPLMIAETGSVVSLSSFGSSFAYIAHNDKTDVADLAWGYQNCNGNILDDIVVDGSSLFEGYVLEEGVNATVKFEKVYRIYVGSGNDTKYDLRVKQADFCSDTLNATSLGYRYLAESNANVFLNDINLREGFGLTWNYAEHGKTAYTRMTTLADALHAVSTSEVDIVPVWSLNKPTVRVVSSDADYSIVYGDDISFEAQATAPADGISLVYKWKHNGNSVGVSDTLSLSKPSLSGGFDGEYVLTVTTYGGEVTSLVSSTEVCVSLAIDKKVISFGWELPAADNRTYSGTAKRVTAILDPTQLVGDDLLSFCLTVNSTSTDKVFSDCIDAGRYTFLVEIDADSALDYRVDSTAKNELVIDKLPVEVIWSDYGFTYNGLRQTPSASALGIFGEELVSVINGGGINAGTYIAGAQCSDGNYLLTNDTLSYTIAKAPLTVTANDCQAVYGNTPAFNGAEYSGFKNNETKAVLGGSLKYSFGSYGNVGVYENGVSISGLSSPNYEITYITGDLEVIPREVIVAWSGTVGLVYNGQAKNVTASVNNRVGNDDVKLTVTNGNCVAAGDYTAYVYTDALTGESSGNYIISQVYEQPYTIAKAKVTITPIPVTVVYGDAEVELTASVSSGEIYNSDFFYTLSREEGVSVGTYVISVGISGDDTNYDIVRNQASYNIIKRTVTITWNGHQNLVYNGSQCNVTATLGNTISSDDICAVVAGGKATDAGTYRAVAALSGNSSGNYALPSEYSVLYVIEKAELSELSVSIENYIYGSPETPVVSGNTGGGAVTFRYGETDDVSESTLETRLDVGSYYVFAIVEETANYKSGVASAAFNVNVRTVTLSWSNYSDLVYDGTAKNVSAVLGNVMSDDDVGIVVTNGNRVNAGFYRAVAILSGSDAHNYVLPEINYIDYTIEKAELSNLSVSLGDYEYGSPGTPVVTGNSGSGSITYTYGETDDVSASASQTNLNVGTYYVFATVAETANYKSGVASATFHVNKRTLTLSWSNYTDLVYDATAKNVTATIGNVLQGENVGIAVTGGDQVNAGTYKAVASIYGADAANYTLPAVNTIDYTIAKAKITLTAQDASSIYGEAVSELTVNVSGTIYNDEVAYSAYSTVTPSTPVGTYEISVLVGEYANYEITTVSGTYTVMAATPDA